MFELSTKYKAFAAAVTGLVMVSLAYFVEDPALLTAIAAVIGTVIVWRVPNEPSAD